MASFEDFLMNTPFTKEPPTTYRRKSLDFKIELSEYLLAHFHNDPRSSVKGGKAGKLDERSQQALLEEAKKIGIKGRHDMKTSELIDAIRNH